MRHKSIYLLRGGADSLAGLLWSFPCVSPTDQFRRLYYQVLEVFALQPVKGHDP